MQHGFQRGKSCTTQLIQVYHNIVEALDKRMEVQCAHLDFSKAFDKVSHAVLLYKLERHRLRGAYKDGLPVIYRTDRRESYWMVTIYSDWLSVTRSLVFYFVY